MSDKIKKLNLLSFRERAEIKSTYQGKTQFSREQLVFVIEVTVASAFDRVVSQIDYVNNAKYCDNAMIYYDGVIENAGMSLAILYAQLTGDGMSIGDVLEITGLAKNIENFVKFCKKNGHKAFVERNDRKCSPDSRLIA